MEISEGMGRSVTSSAGLREQDLKAQGGEVFDTNLCCCAYLVIAFANVLRTVLANFQMSLHLSVSQSEVQAGRSLNCCP